MKNQKMSRVLMVFAAGLTMLVTGCLDFEFEKDRLPANIENTVTSSNSTEALKNAIILAATHRKWLPTVVDDYTIRCTLIQRSNRVVIDIRIHDKDHYSMISVESNISERKFNQWRNNLQREIAKYVALSK